VPCVKPSTSPFDQLTIFGTRAARVCTENGEIKPSYPAEFGLQKVPCCLEMSGLAKIHKNHYSNEREMYEKEKRVYRKLTVDRCWPEYKDPCRESGGGSGPNNRSRGNTV
jgi:hypothetical protein